MFKPGLILRQFLLLGQVLHLHRDVGATYCVDVGDSGVAARVLARPPLERPEHVPAPFPVDLVTCRHTAGHVCGTTRGSQHHMPALHTYCSQPQCEAFALSV
jgi:hypothetical protein